jgi:Glycosyl transferase family 2
MRGFFGSLHQRKPRRPPRLLGVLLCYNDGDLVGEAVQYLVEQGHHVVAWDHGSDDETGDVLQRLRGELVELKTIPRSFDFYDLYPEMSRHLLANYVDRYDWISWPDQDEFLEGPDRARTYEQWVEEVFESPYDWVEFRNFNYWWTDLDRPSAGSTTERVRHYSLFADCPPRIRGWRASATNIRRFNHNEPNGTRYPTLFNLRHYPMRSREHMWRRLERDRAGLRRGASNFHYDNMKTWPERLVIPPDAMHLDDGSELDLDPIFDWRTIYGNAPPRAVRATDA